MNSRRIVAAAAAAVAVLLWSAPVHAQAGHSHEAHGAGAALGIPPAIAAEHGDIHSTLVAALEAPGKVGVAARALAKVLHPHFVREEQIALPPLGLLGPLAAGQDIPDAELHAALAMSDSLRSELPRMLEEHVGIRAAVAELKAAADAAKTPRWQRLAADLAIHARTEEEVLYPAAVLVGDLIRARQHAH